VGVAMTVPKKRAQQVVEESPMTMVG
jgi:hypothetical protein